MNVGWPQAIYLALTLLGLGVEISRHGEPKKPGRYNAVSTLIATVVVLSLLYWGGFFD